MKLLSLHLALVLFAFNLAAQSFAPNQLIVRFHDSNQDLFDNTLSPPAHISPTLEAILQKYKFDRAEAICIAGGQSTHTYVLHFTGNQNVPMMVNEFQATNLFSIVEANGYVEGCLLPNDPVFPRQYGLHNTGNFNLTLSIPDADSDLPEAWDITQGDSNVIVAVLDGGLSFGHPEFAGRAWINRDEIPNNFKDDDSNGFFDDDRGWNFAYNNNAPDDDYGHGSASAGVIGANGNNGIGSAGIDWNCKLMIIKTLDSTNFSTNANVASSIYYAADNGADIINMSLSGGHSSVQEAAIKYAWDKGCALFGATGNSNSNVPGYPAADTNVMAVGGSNAWDVRYVWSNYGAHLDVVAAADYVYIVHWDDFNNDSTYSSGTSLSSPFVAGVAALLKAQKLERTNQQIYEILRMTAEDTIDHYTTEDSLGWDQYFGYGKVNAYAALLYDTVVITDILEDKVDEITIYPNPTSEYLYVRQKTKASKQIEIMDLLGMVVKSQKLERSLTKIDLHALAPGVYVIKTYPDQEVHRFIKK